MLPTTLWVFCLTALSVRAQTTDSSTDFFSPTFSTIPDPSTPAFTGTQYTYVSYSGQSTVSTANSSESSSGSQSTRTTSTESVTRIGGLPGNNNSSSTASSSTSSANEPVNTVPCNNYPEFCNRKYSNITQVCSHNSAFAIPNNVGSNQLYGIIDQLNDGVRMLQGETHWVNKTVFNCHTSCDLLNAGTWQSSLELTKEWVQDHPYDVVTWLIVNSDFRPVTDYVSAIQNSGIAQYLYEPEFVPQRRHQWPTLAEMILSGKRVVLFMDYNANQTEVPYVLDEFSHIWETPFSPTDMSFPCDVQRPPRLMNKEKKARDDFMYLANHNLNTAVDVSAILGTSSNNGDEEILIPNTAYINQTNGQLDKLGQLESMRLNCSSKLLYSFLPST